MTAISFAARTYQILNSVRRLGKCLARMVGHYPAALDYGPARAGAGLAAS